MLMIIDIMIIKKKTKATKTVTITFLTITKRVAQSNIIGRDNDNNNHSPLKKHNQHPPVLPYKAPINLFRNNPSH